MADAQETPSTDPLSNTKYDFPRNLTGYGRHPPHPQWPNNAKIAVSFVMNYEEGGERSVQHGDSHSESSLHEQSGDKAGREGQRSFNTESDYEYGSRVGVWRLLNLFEAHAMPVTCYAVGQALERNTAVAKALVDGGHEVASHGWRWIDYHDVEVETEKAMIRRQLEALKKLTGKYPEGWYYGRLSPRSKALVWEVYREMGMKLAWVGDSYADDLPYWIDVPAEKGVEEPQGMLVVPYTYDNNDLKFHSTTGAFSPEAFFEYLKSAFDVLIEEGKAGSPKMMTIGLHCRIIGKPGRFMALKKFVEYLSSRPEGEVWVARRQNIAEHWRGKFPYEGRKP